MSKRARVDEAAAAPASAAPTKAVTDEAARNRVLNAYGGSTNVAEGTHVEVPPGTLQTALSEYVVQHAKPSSFVAHKRVDVDDDEDEMDPEQIAAGDPEPTAKLMLGFGEVQVLFEGSTFVITRQGFGNPTPKGGGLFTTLAISHPEKTDKVAEDVKKLCQTALVAYEASRPGKIALYSYSKYGWQRERLLLKRPLESVILPADATDKVISDVRRFLDAGTRQWYRIPYKHTFLTLYFPPCLNPSPHPLLTATCYMASPPYHPLVTRGMSGTSSTASRTSAHSSSTARPDAASHLSSGQSPRTLTARCASPH